MAEAAVETPGAGRFFCHKCNQEISPLLPDFICPRCESGFIEELEQNSLDSPSDYEEEDLIPGQQNIFGLLNNAAQTEQEENYRGDDVPPSSSQAALSQRFQGPFYHPTTRVSIRRHVTGGRELAPLEGLLHQILANLTDGGGGFVGNTIPILFNLHSNPGDYVWGRAGLDAIITQLLNQLDCTGPPPLPKEKINLIPTVSITQDQVDKTLQCTVCMEDYKVGEPVRKLACLHHFHNDCIVPWLELHGTCPICRKTLNEAADQGVDEFMFNSGSNNSTNRAAAAAATAPDTEHVRSAGMSPSSSSSTPPHPSVFDFNDEYD